jgi:UrcA family protein
MTLMLNAGAFAAQPEADASMRRAVSFSELDLAHRAGVATLYARIKYAAHDVCKPYFGEWMLEHLASTRACVENAVARAVADVNSPALTSYHQTKTRRLVLTTQR